MLIAKKQIGSKLIYWIADHKMNQHRIAQNNDILHAVTPMNGRLLQRKCACGQHTPGGGQCSACAEKKKLNQPLQTKLKIGEPSDRYEQEADRVAEQVMRMSQPTNSDGYGYLQAKPLVQRRVPNTQGGVTEAPPIVYDVLRSPGQPLDPSTRESMEPRFGHDFSQVRVHFDGRATESANAVNAMAYTVGKHVVFNAGRYAPRKNEGRKLLAHELTHVVQQNDDQRVMQRFVESTEPNSRLGEGAKDVASGLIPIGGIVRGVIAAFCLSDLEGPMGSITFGRWIPHACGRSTSGFLHSREWDAFGHCWIACEGSRKCGRGPTAIAGTSREIYREIEDTLGGSPHDSFSQDMNNQSLGRELSFTAGTCFSLCDSAHTSGSLDLSAPKRVCATCATYPASGSEGPCP